jgi:regulator of cell morphogenesis and NO signaling
MITLTTKLSDLIHADVFALTILQRLEIPLGFGDITIEEICLKHHLHPQFFLLMTRLFLYDEIPDEVENDPELLPHLIDYLQCTHKFYLSNHVPLIEKYIGLILRNEPHRSDDISLLIRFFEKYKKELFVHLDNEDRQVFPYAIRLHQCFEKKECTPEFYQEIISNPVTEFEETHDNLDEKLNDLKNIIIKYLPSFQSEHEIHQILILLFQLEKDIFQHAQLEDLLMVPVVKKIEIAVQSFYRGGNQ